MFGPLLTRRGRALARRTLPLRHGIYVIGTIDNFCTPHESLCYADPVAEGTSLAKTPAMVAGIADHCWTDQELLSFHVPPPLIERWCGDHG